MNASYLDKETRSKGNVEAKPFFCRDGPLRRISEKRVKLGHRDHPHLKVLNSRQDQCYGSGPGHSIRIHIDLDQCVCIIQHRLIIYLHIRLYLIIRYCQPDHDELLMKILALPYWR